jgi:hypothetical protein
MQLSLRLNALWLFSFFLSLIHRRCLDLRDQVFVHLLKEFLSGLSVVLIRQTAIQWKALLRSREINFVAIVLRRFVNFGYFWFT